MEFLIILLLIILNGFFAMSEIAMISARRSNLEMQARQGIVDSIPVLRAIEQGFDKNVVVLTLSLIHI